MPYAAPVHKPKSTYDSRYDKQRGSSSSRGYNSKWRRVRKAKLTKDPACQWQGCTTPSRPATLVHHIDENPHNNSWDNLMSVCTQCHNQIHNRVKQVFL